MTETMIIIAQAVPADIHKGTKVHRSFCGGCFKSMVSSGDRLSLLWPRSSPETELSGQLPSSTQKSNIGDSIVIDRVQL